MSRKRAAAVPGQRSLSEALGAKAYVAVKPQDLARHVGKEMHLKGSFWDDCADEDEDTLYPVRVVP